MSLNNTESIHFSRVLYFLVGVPDWLQGNMSTPTAEETLQSLIYLSKRCSGSVMNPNELAAKFRARWLQETNDVDD